MREIRAAIVALLCVSSASAVHAEPTLYVLDSVHSRVTFTVRKWGIIDVEGHVPEVRGTIRWDAAQPAASTTSWEVGVASIRTGEPDRDASLLAPEYFDVARYPLATFASGRVTSTEGTRITLEGQLTMRGVTRPVSVVVTSLGEQDVPFEGRLAVFETAFTVDRRAFGIVGGRVLGPVISDTVQVRVRAVARRAPDRR